MMNPKDIFDPTIPFSQKMESVFRYQLEHQPVYRRFCEALKVDVNSIPDLESVPLLPVEAFRDAVIGEPESAELEFRSSGTTGMKRSVHYVRDASLYRTSILEGMRYFYETHDFSFLCYTPGYNENPHSSLIWMLRTLIESDKTGLSRFLKLNQPIGTELIRKVSEKSNRLILFGAAFGLLDLAEKHPVKLPENSIIIETGGMKTYRREMSRNDMHKRLAEAFQLSEENVHSEYGMTEMLSQAYSGNDGWFHCPPWLNISIRDPQNPLIQLPDGEEGLLGIIDLANIHSCSFLLTGDKGVKKVDAFQVLGRFEPENLRGCNFLIDQD